MMAEGRNVVKQLRKDGIASLFTNRFLQNMEGKFDKRLNYFSREIEREPNARRHVVMNLLGYLNFKARKYSEANGWFEKVLEEDATSINALLNLLFTYEQMKLTSYVDEYEKKIQDILSNGSLAGKSKAYAKHELAGIMSAVDAHLQPGGVLVIQSLFREAMHCDEVPQDDKKDWLFDYAFFGLNVDAAYGETQSQYFEKSMEYFYQIVTSQQPSPSDIEGESARQERFNDIVAKSWCFMGTLLSRYNRGFKDDGEPKQLKDVIDCPKGFSDCTLQSCMEKANEKATEVNKPVIMRRTGLVHMGMGSMAEAKDCFQRAVSLNEEDGYGHNLLGRWNLKKYEQENTTKTNNLLNDAIHYFSDALKKGFDKWHCYRELAKAHFLNGEYKQANWSCLDSEQHGGDKEIKLYELWAQIYDQMGVPDSAEKCRVKLNKIAEGQYHDVHDFGVVYHDDDIDQIAPQVIDLEKQLHVRCFLLDRDVLCGENTVKAWGNLDKSCRYILVFCSDTFFEGNSVAYCTLTSIINDRCARGNGSTIIPVKLPGCKDIPEVLKPRRAIEVDGSDNSKFIEEIERKVNSR